MTIHYRNTKKRSTNVRDIHFRRWAARGALKMYWNIAPAKAEGFVKNNFFKPAEYRTTDEENRLLGIGSKFQINVHEKTIQGWKWGEGPAILLVHGWNGRGIQFFKFFELIRQAGFAIITFDAPAHGESSGTTSSYFEWTDTVREFLNPQNGFDIRGIIGHSLGGSAVINALSKENAAVPCALIAPALKLTDIMLNTFRMYGIPAVIYAKVIEDYEHRFGYTLEGDNPADLIPGINTDLLIVHDRLDETVPFSDSQECAGVLPRVRLHSTSGLGHKRILKDRKMIELITEYFIKQRKAASLSEHRRKPLIASKISGKHMEICRTWPENCSYLNMEQHGMKCIHRDTFVKESTG